mmetsp:Transcript_296/g.813  ORF Transcript_296/g.813 Transcript_296/m.813 type:complete len:237 (-) Transcript_296:61-771(-)
MAHDEASREAVLAAVSEDGWTLHRASIELRSDKGVVMAAVSQNGTALRWAATALTSDKEVVMAAVSQHGCALQWATTELKGDKEIVMAAVSQDGCALEFAETRLRSNREVVVVAVSQNGLALQHAGEELLADPLFAEEARKLFYFFNITALSGRSCLVASCHDGSRGELLSRACRQLGMQMTGGEILLHGAEEVPNTSNLPSWPGAPIQGGAVTEYQLVKSKRPRYPFDDFGFEYL